MSESTQYIVALDQGTTSSRALLFDRQGQVIGTAQREFNQHYPNPGWVEHDPIEIWASQRATLTELLAKSRVSHHQVAAIGITNQRETTVVWDRETGQPIHNAIVWQCRRTADLCTRLKQAGLEQRVRDKTGLVLDPYFSATKVRWILDHVPGARQRAEQGKLAFGTIDSWLIWNLTEGQVHATDATNASRTMLFNIHTLEWDSELLEAFQIPASMLPEVKASGELYGQAQLGNARVPISGVAGDQQAALFGQLCHSAGMAKNTYGTGCFLLMHTGNTPVASRHGLLTTLACNLPGEINYALEGAVFMGGASVQWLRDELGLIRHASESEALAQEVADTQGAYLVPAFTGLGAPHWDPFARGTLVGMTRGTNRQHLVRATLESIAYQSMDILHAMEQDAGQSLSQLRVDGGATANRFLMQFQADILGTPVVRPANVETTAAGAAYLAGLTCGYWPDLDTLASEVDEPSHFRPAMSQETQARLTRGWQRALAASRHWSSLTDEPG
ncbi:glycerol kinase GlpK [Ferrimonas sediminicola]|uniref:Glycerol kinase n=1 Tax=Ferrimonas sediminicola TaxID=2569538 RepID=A0A4U1BBW6_9GAMM|nr:glycerol kinase GlpK [Ferrimonas sediminicola]TKB47933.1 glycerol kinase GlpK [Ferrimonas sediminicola]